MVREGFFLFWADIGHVVTILSADQQVANVAAAVAFIIHIRNPAGPKQIQSMAGLLTMLIWLKFILVVQFMVF